MNPFITQLAVEHLQDLLREAEQERRWKLIRSGEGASGRSMSVARRIAAALRRLWGSLSGTGRSRPATARPIPSRPHAFGRGRPLEICESTWTHRHATVRP